jgi:hypothetical protein
MRSLHREVHSYRVDNENIMKAQEEILQSLNMLQKKSNKGLWHKAQKLVLDK